MVGRHYLISGRVQGVGFRNFTATNARLLGVSGWVRNLLDGRVEVLAAAPAEDLRKFEMKLREGPRHGLVQELRLRDVEISAAIWAEFKVVGDGEDAWSPKC